MSGKIQWHGYIPPTTLTLYREGQTDWKVGGAFHCGTDAALHKDGHLGIRWQVEIVATPALDSHGFLFDQTTVAAEMEELAKTPTGLSCERLAEYVGYRMVSRIRLEDPGAHLQSIRVRMSPEPYVAWIEARWEL